MNKRERGGFTCVFEDCNNNSTRNPSLSFFRFPKDPERSEAWVNACGREDLRQKTPQERYKNYRVCGGHFSRTEFANDLRNRLQPTACPKYCVTTSELEKILLQPQSIGGSKESCEKMETVEKMPGCCVPDCKNYNNGRRNSKFRFFRVPQGKNDEERIKVWKKFINRTNLPASAVVCEAHFEESQFENKRADNRKFLKWNAIPTITVSDLQNRVKTEPIDPNEELEVILTDCTDPLDITTNTYNNTTSDEVIRLVIKKPTHNDAEKSNQHHTNLQFQRLKSELKNAKQKINVLEKRIAEIEGRYSGVFGEDQLRFMRHGSHRGEKWSEDTIEKALRLYVACGSKGYEEIIKQRIPLPSIRTLQHRLSTLEFKPGLLDDVEFIEVKDSHMECVEIE